MFYTHQPTRLLCTCVLLGCCAIFTFLSYYRVIFLAKNRAIEKSSPIFWPIENVKCIWPFHVAIHTTRGVGGYFLHQQNVFHQLVVIPNKLTSRLNFRCIITTSKTLTGLDWEKFKTAKKMYITCNFTLNLHLRNNAGNQKSIFDSHTNCVTVQWTRDLFLATFFERFKWPLPFLRALQLFLNFESLSENLKWFKLPKGWR